MRNSTAGSSTAGTANASGTVNAASTANAAGTSTTIYNDTALVSASVAPFGTAAITVAPPPDGRAYAGFPLCPEAAIAMYVQGIQRVAETIYTRIERPNASAGPALSTLAELTQRDESIKSFKEQCIALRRLLGEMESRGQRAEAEHAREVRDITDRLRQMQSREPRTEAPPPKPAPAPKPPREGKRSASIPAGVAPSEDFTSVLVEGPGMRTNVWVSALVLRDDCLTKEEVFAAVAARPGVLHYVSTWRYFAFGVQCGPRVIVFSTGLGEVYPAGHQKPQRVEDCTRQGCDRTCGFYHNPAEHIGSIDRRNFYQGTFGYRPTAEAPAKGGKARHLLMCPILNPATAEDDIRFASPKEISLQIAAVSHSVLMTIIAALGCRDFPATVRL